MGRSYATSRVTIRGVNCRSTHSSTSQYHHTARGANCRSTREHHCSTSHCQYIERRPIAKYHHTTTQDEGGVLSPKKTKAQNKGRVPCGGANQARARDWRRCEPISDRKSTRLN